MVHAGGIPVFVDMDPESFGVRPEDAVKSISARTAGMIVVHISGIVSARMPALVELAKERGIWLLEDAAHQHLEVLVHDAGHHALIEKWRRKEALRRTLNVRPELLEKAKLSMDDCGMIADIADEFPDREPR